MKQLTTVLLLFISFALYAQEEINIIPKPQQLEVGNGSFSLTESTTIAYTKGLDQQAELLFEALSPATGFDFEITEATKSKKNTIFISIDSKAVENVNGYTLDVTKNGVVIVGHDASGVFYGVQSLLQLLPTNIFSEIRQRDIEWNIQSVSIADYPTYEWRGMMLDVSRYFFEKEFVLRFIDMMAMYKMNTLHLHLIDDAGWRLEIKKYPKLTEIGAWRGEGENRTGGFYTQEDLKEMVAYGIARNVEIIPEIEIPAHTLCAVAAYPWLSCREEQLKVPEQHFISRDLYCVGKESTFDFLEDVFDETFAIFPSKYVHVGGDEARYDRWRECPHCQKRKKDLELESEKDLQVYFTNRLQKMAAKHGKTIVGWDEILERGLEGKAVGMIWHNKKKTFSAVADGHDVVMSLTDHSYFDFPESKTPGEVKAATWRGPISLEKAYSFDPMIEGLDEKYRSQVLGASATLWSDQFIHGTILQEIENLNENRSETYIEYLTLPRLAALAEVCWTKEEDRSFDDFESRMSSHYNRYDVSGYSYRVPEPKLISKEMVQGKYVIDIENVVEGAELRYTTNGIKPNVHSPLYTEPVKVDDLSQFKAITVVSRTHYSLPLYFPEKYAKYKKYGQFVAEWTPAKITGFNYSTLELNVTGKVDKNGKYELSFWFTDGTYRLDIDGIEVFKNGNKIAEDKHFGYTGGSAKNNTFKFKVDDYETGAAFTVKARVRGDEGKDSNGVIFIK